MRTTTLMALLGATVLWTSGVAATRAADPQQTKGDSPTRPAAAATPEATSATKPLVEMVQTFAKTYTERDVNGLIGLFLEEARVVDASGDDVRGVNDIAAMYAASMESVPGVKLEAEPRDIQFLTPDVARVEGRSRLKSPTGDANEYTRFSALAVKKDGAWRIAELRDYPAPSTDITPYERLQELEWMIGDWVDESETNKVSASIRWADNKSYIIRTYRVEIAGEKAMSGTMFIGWDPTLGQIKSWVFDSEGGHGEGLWTRSADNQWIIKAQGVLRDGRPTSATQIHTIVNRDAVKTSSIDRIIGGQIAQDVNDLLMVRKPPQPGPTDSKK